MYKKEKKSGEREREKRMAASFSSKCVLRTEEGKLRRRKAKLRQRGCKVEMKNFLASNTFLSLSHWTLAHTTKSQQSVAFILV